jgi:hypothetical protein
LKTSRALPSQTFCDQPSTEIKGISEMVWFEGMASLKKKEGVKNPFLQGLSPKRVKNMNLLIMG